MSPYVSYSIIVILIVLIVTLERGRFFLFIDRMRRKISSTTEKNLAKKDESQKDISEKVGMEDRLIEISAHLNKLNENIGVLYEMIENNLQAMHKTQQSWTEGIGATLLKSSNSSEGFVSSLQSLLQRNLDKLNSIGPDTTVANTPESERYRTPLPVSENIQTPGAGPVEEFEHVIVSPTASTPDPFDQFVVRHKEEITQASYKGIKGVQSLVQQISHQHPIELDCPSDQVFILVNRDSKPHVTGKAFVLPGSYLGRPWVDWFDMPKGVYERVELTLEAATVSQDPNGDWSLTESGTVSQQ